MMLQALCELARREGQGQDPVLAPRPNDFVCVLAPAGRLLSLIDTRDEKGRGLEIAAPRLPKGRTGTKILAVPLADNAKYVFGLQAKADGENVNQERLDDCADAFAALVDGLRSRLLKENPGARDEGLEAVSAFLRDRESARDQVLAERPRNEWTGSEWLAFKLQGDQVYVHERPEVLRELQQRVASDEGLGSSGQCLVSGEIGPIARLHPLIKNIPGTRSAGGSIVSFNADSFESFGLKKGDNSPVSVKAAREYGAGLNWLLERYSDRRHRSGVDVGDEVLVFWCRSRTDTPDLIASFFAPSEDQFANAASSPFAGVPPPAIPDDTFYALFLGGQDARVIVRDWIQTTAAVVHESLRSYWADLNLAGGTGRPRPVWALLNSLKGPNGVGLQPDLEGRLVQRALQGGLFPPELLVAALRRLRIPPPKVSEGNGFPTDRQQLHDRCSIIKAVLNRQFRASQRKELSVSLDESCKDQPYLLGRLFAVIERLQGAALGDVNASIRDKFFGSASTRPGLIFPRLVSLSIHHAAKAERSAWLEKLKGEIFDGLPSARYPAVMSLEDQGLFAIGYYHQRQRFFEKRGN